MSENRKYILDEAAALKKLQRMAFEIAEQNLDENKELILAGIRDNGVVLAKILQTFLKDIYLGAVRIIEVSLDKRQPRDIHVSEEIAFNESVIILVDDVTNSGKTLLYALKPFLNHQPKKIQTLTLIERSHKVFPIKSDYVGISLSTTLQEHIFVEVNGDRVTGAYLV